MPVLAKGVRPGINRNGIYSQVAKVPPSEQRRIVGTLDKAFDGIASANLERSLQTPRSLFESHLQAVFTQHGEGWVETTLGAEVDLPAGFAFKSTRYTESDESVRLLRGDDRWRCCSRNGSTMGWPQTRYDFRR